MNTQRIVIFLKKIQRNLKFFLIFGEISEESLWAFAPSQGIVAALKAPKNLFLQMINSDRVVVPFLLFQGLILLFNASLLYLIAALDKETDKTKRNFLKAINNTLACIAIAGIVTFIMLANIKLLIGAYLIQSAIEIFFAGVKLFKAIKEHVTRTKHVTNDHYLIQTQQNNKANNNVNIAARSFLMSSLFLVLTGLSFAPIPLISNIAQIVLVCITVYHLADAVWSRYNKYKKQKINPENIENNDSNMSTQKVLQNLKADLTPCYDDDTHQNQVASSSNHTQVTNEEIWQKARTKNKMAHEDNNISIPNTSKIKYH